VGDDLGGGVYCRGGGVSKEFDTGAEGLGDRVAYGLSWRGESGKSSSIIWKQENTSEYLKTRADLEVGDEDSESVFVRCTKRKSRHFPSQTRALWRRHR
jgi:hypothetical protein